MPKVDPVTFYKGRTTYFLEFRLDQTSHVIVSSFKSLHWIFLFTGRNYYAAPTNKLSLTLSDQCTAIMGCCWILDCPFYSSPIRTRSHSQKAPLIKWRFCCRCCRCCWSSLAAGLTNEAVKNFKMGKESPERRLSVTERSTSSHVRGISN